MMAPVLRFVEWLCGIFEVESFFSRAMAGAYRKGVRDAFAGTIQDPTTEPWCSLFEPGEEIPLKAIVFEVRAVNPEGMLLAPVGVTKKGREIAKRNREERGYGREA